MCNVGLPAQPTALVPPNLLLGLGVWAVELRPALALFSVPARPSGICRLNAYHVTGEPATRIAKVTNVPTGTSKEFLSVVFARAYRVKLDMTMTAADTKKAKAAQTARDKAKAKRKAEAKAAAAAAKGSEANDEENEVSEEDSETEDEEEEKFGRFSG